MRHFDSASMHLQLLPQPLGPKWFETIQHAGQVRALESDVVVNMGEYHFLFIFKLQNEKIIFY